MHYRRATPKIQYAISKRWEAEQETGQSAQCTPQNLLSSIFCCCARRVGSLHFLCERRDGSPIVVAGPMWPFCTFVTLPLVAGLSSLVLYFCILQKGAPLVRSENYCEYLILAIHDGFHSHNIVFIAILGSFHLCACHGNHPCVTLHGFL